MLDALQILASIDQLPENEKEGLAEAIYQPLKDYLVFNDSKSLLKHTGFHSMVWMLSLGIASALAFGAVMTFLPVINLTLLALLLSSCTGFISHRISASQRAKVAHEKLTKAVEEVLELSLDSAARTVFESQFPSLEQATTQQDSEFELSSNTTSGFWSSSNTTPNTEEEDQHAFLRANRSC